jgi:hypothetical protein
LLLEKKCASSPTIAAAVAKTATKTASPEVAMALPHPHPRPADIHDDEDNNSVTDKHLNTRATEVVGSWTRAEDAELASAVANTKKKNKSGKRDWVEIAALVRGRAKKQCRNRWQNTLKPSIDKATGHSGVWAEDEDLKLRHALQMHDGKDGKDWFAIASFVSGQTKKSVHEYTGYCFESYQRAGDWTFEDMDRRRRQQAEGFGTNAGGKGWVAICSTGCGSNAKAVGSQHRPDDCTLR